MRASGVRRRTTAGDTRALLYGGGGSSGSRPPTLGPALVTLLRTLALVCAGLVVLVSVGFVGYVERAVGDPFTAMPERPARVAVVDLVENARWRKAEPASLEHWHTAATRAGLELEYHEVASVAELAVERFSVLVLPEQERMSALEWERVRALARADLGLVFTGHPGLQDQRGKRRDLVLLGTLAPRARFERLDLRKSELVVDALVPLVAGFEPGAVVVAKPPRRALVRAGAGPLVWRRGDDAWHGTAAWDWLRDGLPVVWLSLGPHELDDAEAGLALASHALALASRRPIATLRPWPRGAPAAAVLSRDPDALEASGLGAAAHAPDPALAGAPALQLGRVIAAYDETEREAGVFAVHVPEPPEPRRARKRRGVRPGPAHEAPLDFGRELRRELDLRQAWLAPAPEVVAWSAQRARVRVALELEGPGQASVSLTNAGTERIRDATVRVFLPLAGRPPSTVERRGGSPRPLVRIARDRTWIDLVVPSVPPGRSHAYAFHF